MINKVKEAHDILGLLLPTNEPDTFFKYFLPSLNNMKEVAPITTIALNFQHPWNRISIEKAVLECEKIGFRVLYQFIYSYPIWSTGYVPFNKIRHDAAMLVPKSILFALTDDDFQYEKNHPEGNFSAGHQYLCAVKYLLRFKRCGVVSMNRGQTNIPNDMIGMSSLDKTYGTGSGLIFRNMYPEFFVYPDDAIILKGAGEENIIGCSRVHNGLYPANMSNSATKHDEIRQSKEVKSGDEMYEWTKEEVADSNVNRYIDKTYNIKNDKKRPRRILNENLYYSNGGMKIDENFDSHLINFSNSSSDELLNEIIEKTVIKA